ncbi:hypothetical protein IAQ61_004011 [Plenodomus lingam]|uniref:uncharacterized protein n=1 Tax=Leptosphaeria maculans TaxID=5022 RepID=UPI0033229770|nr:hypothetical protein IAQ61_004011 [Plenodomus lingam]
MRAGQKFCSSIDCVGQEKIVRIALGRIEVIDWADLDDMDSGRGYDFIVVGASAKKEVILCGGAIDTPRLLLVNGIGPKEELEALGIEVKRDLPGVGKHLQDHVLAFMSVEVDGSANDRYAFESDQGRVAEAEAAWKKDKSGAFALSHSCLWGGFFKLPDLQNMAEFQALPKKKQAFLTRDTVPSYEFISNCLLWPPGSKIEEGNSYMTFITFLMNPQSEGSVTLRSSHPSDKPVIRLHYLEHPYDARIFREAIRSTWQKLVLNPGIAPSVVRTICGPASLSDEDVDGFARENAGTVWHANGTVKMGREEDGGACVDTGFRVRGVEGLRVVDLSVAPLTPNNHTQATAYLIGWIAADKLVGEYGLDG